KSTTNRLAVQPETLIQFRESFLQVYQDWLGLKTEEESGSESTDTVNGLMSLLTEIRTQARKDKNWAVSDQIRDQLGSLGIKLEDTSQGTDWYYEN
ncbi:MAG: cysteine--tRNA ligase, partial [Bacteroidota bacterium]